MITHYAVYYTCRHWIGKPDPNGFGKCSQVFLTLIEAEQKIKKLQAKGHGSIKLRLVKK